MAISYDQRKQKYESFDDNQKQQWNNMVNNSKEGDVMRQYMSQYNNETNNTPQSNNNSSNFNNQNGTNGQNQTNTRQLKGDNLNSNLTTEYVDDNGGWRSMNYDDRKKEYENMDEAGKKGYSKFLNSQSDDYWGRGFMDTYSEENGLDTSKFQQDPGKITVQEGTAQQTGRPDYGISTDARLNEMKGNLDHYFATSPRMFSDRETFNRVFEYNNRDSEAQRQLLDSYWKRKEDMDKASQYTSGESIMNGLNNSEITTDQLNLIKDTDPEAYRKRQELQEEEIKKRIVNSIVPPLLEEISQNMVNMMNNLGIQPQEAEDIEGVYNDTMDRTQAWQTMEDANRTVKRIEEVNNQRTAIMNRYAASTGGTVSDALAAARMQKALAPYDTEMQGLQYQYQDYANLFSQKQAAAYQAAQVRQMQASENQRVWNQRLTALGFAQTAMSYRTPEQQAQLRLQEQQAQNEMQLLQQSRLNDLNRYNQYATAKMQNQLQQELTDLSVEDEAQLKANLNNALSDYYKNYGDIIQRSQAQTVEDIIEYAKDHNMSVAQAMTENFIKPLQNKAEYKQKVATDYGMLSKQTIGTINGRSVIMTQNPNGSISYQYIDSGITDSYTIDGVDYVVYNGQQMTAKEFNEKYGNKVGTVKPYDMVSNSAFELANEYGYTKSGTLGAFMSDPKNQEGQKGGQCAKFVNDYLESIGVGRYFGTEDVKTRESRCNSDTAKVGTIAVFDYNHYTDGKNYGHVGIVVATDKNGFWVLDSNGDTKKPGVIEKRYIRYGSSSCKGFFDPSQPPRTTETKNTLSAVDEAKKQNYLEEAKRGKLTPSKIEEIGDLAAEQGWDDEWREAFKGGQNWDYSDTQLKRMDRFYSDFKDNTDVKNFDKAKDQFRQLVVALNDESGVGDMSAIFTFMKTLDPTSVVREGEFAAAQNTIGDANWDAILLKLENHINGERLSKKQRQQFKEVAQEFIRIQADSYQQQYDFLKKRYEGAGIDEADLPPNTAQILLDSLGGLSTGPTNDTQKYFDGLQSTLPTNTGNITPNAMYSKVDFILNGNLKDAN